MSAGTLLSKKSPQSESKDSFEASKEVSESEGSTNINLSALKIGDDNSSKDEFTNDLKIEQKNDDELETFRKSNNPAEIKSYKPHSVPTKKVPPHPRNRSRNQYQNKTNGDKNKQRQSVIFGSDTRKIAEWIFASFRDIPSQNRKYVELELKFGTILDKQTRKRINLNATTKRIYRDRRGLNFNMSVDESAWTDVTKFLQELEYDYGNELIKFKDENKPRKKFTTTDIDITDSIHQVRSRGELPKRVRISKDNKSDRCWGIEKKRIGDLFIHNSSSMYDWRLSLSLEIPATEAIVESLVAKTPILVREKKRNTWADLHTATRYDLTRVLTPRNSKNYAGKTIVTHEKNYEIEVEIDAMEVFNAMDKTDRPRFKELVDIYLNNARMLNNRVTKLAPRYKS